MDYEAIAKEIWISCMKDIPTQPAIEAILRAHFPEPAPADQGEELADPQNEASNDDWDEFDSMEDWAHWNSTGLYNGLFCLTKWPKDKTDAAIAQLDMIYEYTMRVMSRALAARPQPKESATDLLRIEGMREALETIKNEGEPESSRIAQAALEGA